MRNCRWISILAGILLHVGSRKVAGESFNNYNQYCSAKKKCDALKGLECIYHTDEDYGRCSCHPLAIYNPTAGTCNNPVMRPCDFGNELVGVGCAPGSMCQGKTVLGKAKSTTNNYVIEQLENVRGATDNSCYCVSGFYHRDLGGRNITCFPCLSYGETCSPASHPTCDPVKRLVCGKNGVCECDHAEAKYSTEYKACIVPIGGHCVPLVKTSVLCAHNGVCLGELVNLQVDIIRKYKRFNYAHIAYVKSMLLSRKNVCVCPPGFKLTNGSCSASFGMQCSDTSPCNSEEFLACIDGICYCDRAMNSSFSKDGGCRLLPGSECSTTSGPKCLQNSTCSNSKCQFTQKYLRGDIGDDFLRHGSNCSLTIDHKNKKCNANMGLACKNGQCACFDSALNWDDKIGCITKGEGSNCGEYSIFPPSNYGNLARNFSVDDLLHEFIPDQSYMPPRVRKYYVGCPFGFNCVFHNTQKNPKWLCKK